MRNHTLIVIPEASWRPAIVESVFSRFNGLRRQSESFRTFEGAGVFVPLRSIVSTAPKQNCNILHALTSARASILIALAA